MLASMLILLLPRRGHYRALVVPHTCLHERTFCAQALKANLLLREYAISFLRLCAQSFGKRCVRLWGELRRNGPVNVPP